LGLSSHRGWIARWADVLNPPTLPTAGSLDVREFSRDTAFVFGRDTVFAYSVPGHTPGAAVYLFRGTLFAGDAVGFTRWGGFGSARPGYSDDTERAAESLKDLWPRLPKGAVRYVCTAHAHCAPLDDRFMRDVAPGDARLTGA
ncbi:MAG: hypothetical protein H0X64_07630, partial [Gemmatimonadaceae bacterium]|nr:hypothetical protein [Gemmatimonadaceae bacterium]